MSEPNWYLTRKVRDHEHLLHLQDEMIAAIHLQNQQIEARLAKLEEPKQ